MESAIRGTGYGDKHMWIHMGQAGHKQTAYRCQVCGELFVHAYDETPDIFEAMKKYGVKEECR